MENKFKLLNLGCGNRFHPDWVNVSFFSKGKEVLAHDLKKGIPFPSETFDFVYHSHLLEHFSKKEAFSFLIECCRVLKPGGMIRIATPDLEALAKVYLHALQQAKTGSIEWINRYEWIMLELYDQTVRTQSGGDMFDYFLQDPVPEADFVIQRCGTEAKNMMTDAKKTQIQSPVTTCGRWRKKIQRIIHDPSYRNDCFLKLILGKKYPVYRLGHFHQSGEMHKWMYDSFSLSRLLIKTGFSNCVQKNAAESSFPQWNQYLLDMEEDGSIYKPDSLFMEAVKPDLIK
ncbi:MAG: methyltransferase domain-containing protein [Candidatus Aureabacteria bacterium]|nr:methyltransferase domain-containing protein [Candidatus Auribacterota bacterium]